MTAFGSIAHSVIIEFQARPNSARSHLAAHMRHLEAALDGSAVRTQSDCTWSIRQSNGGEVQVTLSLPEPAAAARARTFRAIAVGSSDEESRRVLSEFARLPFTDEEMAATTSQLPITHDLPRLTNRLPLTGIGILLTIHHMSDFLVLIDALIALGASPALMTVVDKQYPYLKSQRVDAHLLRRHGIHVGRYSELADTIREHFERVSRGGARSLIMDDGGYVSPVIASELAYTEQHWLGVVEQTTSGIWKLEPLELRYPVFSVAESRLKATIESYGIADAAVRNVLTLLPHEKFEGQQVVVLGYGRIGRQVSNLLRSRRMRVAVFDKDITSLLRAHEEGFETRRELHELLRNCRPMLIVGCAGRNSFGLKDALHLSRDCYLVSTTSRDFEFNLPELRDGAAGVKDLGLLGTQMDLSNGVSLTVLGHGMPINFHYAESVANKYIDVVMASLLVGAVTLAQPDHGFEPGLGNRERTDRALTDSGIIDAYYAMHGPEGHAGSVLADGDD